MTISGCSQFLLPNDVDESRPLMVTELQSLNHWLAVSKQVGTMSVEQVVVALQDLERPDRGGELFYYGALNQQLDRFDGWIQARDAFRQLANDTHLEPSLRELADILLNHNQSLINWHERHRHLQKELAESVLDRELLEQKIEALTDLEAVISHRKQQVIGDD
tara:strand:+ start:13293 stop:13781 length:489 start_codon:yes stop_codon:yes gene_type:complete